MAQVLFNKVRKVFPGDVVAVNEFELEVADKEFVVLVGTSGCGKSTTLRMVAGLEEIDGEDFDEATTTDIETGKAIHFWGVLEIINGEAAVNNVKIGDGEMPDNDDTVRIYATSAVAGSEFFDIDLSLSLSESEQAQILQNTGRLRQASFGQGDVLAGTIWFADPMGSSGHLEARLDGTITYDASDRSDR